MKRCYRRMGRGGTRDKIRKGIRKSGDGRGRGSGTKEKT